MNQIILDNGEVGLEGQEIVVGNSVSQSSEYHELLDSLSEVDASGTETWEHRNTCDEPHSVKQDRQSVTNETPEQGTVESSQQCSPSVDVIVILYDSIGQARKAYHDQGSRDGNSTRDGTCVLHKQRRPEISLIAVERHGLSKVLEQLI